MTTEPKRRDSTGKIDPLGEYVARDGKLVRKPFPRASGTEGSPVAATSKPTTGPGAEPAPSPAPPAPGRGPGLRRRGAKYSTWFKALGTIGRIKEMHTAESPDLLEEELDEYAAPSAFYSNQSGLLGRVKWEGIIPLDLLIDQLNLKLQFRGEESPEFDFRTAYTHWEYRYQIIETRGPTDKVIYEENRKDGRLV